MATSSINIQPVKTHSESHNNRLVKLDYARVDLSSENQSWSIRSIAETIATTKVLVKEKTGRAMQEKATPVREGVVNLEAHHTIEDLKNLGKVLEERFGIKAIQAYVHRDEGHYTKEKKWIPNYHGHIVFNWTNENTGKAVRLNREDMRDFQTVVAETLGMNRGVASDKKHLNSLQFKVKAKIEDLAALTFEVINLKSEISRSEKNLADFKDSKINPEKLGATANFMGMYNKSTIDSLVNLLEVKETALKRAEQKISQLEKEISLLPKITQVQYQLEIESNKRKFDDIQKALQELRVQNSKLEHEVTQHREYLAEEYDERIDYIHLRKEDQVIISISEERAEKEELRLQRIAQEKERVQKIEAPKIKGPSR